MKSNLENLSLVLSYPKARKAIIISALLYIIFYLFIIGDLTYSTSQLTSDAPIFRVVEDWHSRLFKEKVSFNYEAVASVYFTNNFAFLISPLNILLGSALSILIGLNIGFLVFAFGRPKACGSKSYSGIFSSLPTVFMGFTCCAPTILMALGSAAASITLGFIALRSIFYPLAFVGLLISLQLNLKKIKSYA